MPFTRKRNVPLPRLPRSPKPCLRKIEHRVTCTRLAYRSRQETKKEKKKEKKHRMCNRKSGTGALVSVAQAELDVPRAPRLGKRNDSYETEQFLTSFFPPLPFLSFFSLSPYSPPSLLPPPPPPPYSIRNPVARR